MREQFCSWPPALPTMLAQASTATPNAIAQELWQPDHVPFSFQYGGKPSAQLLAGMANLALNRRRSKGRDSSNHLHRSGNAPNGDGRCSPLSGFSGCSGLGDSVSQRWFHRYAYSRKYIAARRFDSRFQRRLCASPRSRQRCRRE